MINDILRKAVAAKASDVHINAGSAPLFRIHTVVAPADFAPLKPETVAQYAKGMMGEKRWAEFQQHRDSDFSYEIAGVSRFRVNAHYQRNTVALSIRTVNDVVRPLEQLFLPAVITKLTYLPRGL